MEIDTGIDNVLGAIQEHGQVMEMEQLCHQELHSMEANEIVKMNMQMDLGNMTQGNKKVDPNLTAIVRMFNFVFAKLDL